MKKEKIMKTLSSNKVRIIGERHFKGLTQVLFILRMVLLKHTLFSSTTQLNTTTSRSYTAEPQPLTAGHWLPLDLNNWRLYSVLC